MAAPLTEQSHRASKDLDRLTTDDFLLLMSSADAEIAAAVALQTPQIAQAVDAIAHRLELGGRLFYIGAGTSGRLGVLDAAECPPTFGVPPDLVQGIIAGGPSALVRAVEAVEDDAQAGAADLLSAGLRPSDALVGIAASGRTPYVIGALQKAR
ncbi:MAG: N-acetylmuramic acid 6-phosphate etherase, partial [Acidobacteriota bacterium]